MALKTPLNSPRTQEVTKKTVAPPDVVSEETIKHAVMAGDSEMARIMRGHDWSKTPLGPVRGWPQSLRTALSICLNSRFPIVIWWGRDLILLYNDSWHPIVGKKHPAMLGHPGHEHFPETWDVIGPMLKGVLETGQATFSDDKLLLINKAGLVEECYYTWSYSPIRSEDGEVGGVFTAVTETTSRVIGERRLRTLRDLGAMAAAVKSTEEAAWRLAIEALERNRSDIPFAALYAISHDRSLASLIGSVAISPGTKTCPKSVTLSDGAGEDLWRLAEVVATRTALPLTGLIARIGSLPGGPWDLSPDRAYALPVIAFGECVAVLVAGISPRLRFDDNYRDFLHTAASHLGTAIANARAYQTERKRAEALAELDRAKTAFFSNVSHELRTPLTLMLGPLEEVLAKAPQEVFEDNRHLVEVAHRNGSRLLKLVNTLLDFSRIEAGRIKATYRPTALAEFTAELASIFRSATDRAGLTMSVECGPLAEAVYVDREMWEKIVLNLLSNAFKFTFTGGITVRLEEKVGTVELSVQDTGVGIPDGELPRIFDRFHRVEGSQGRSFEGSGIGLALVQELVNLHGGTITAESELGSGTTFRVVLPLGCAHLPAERVVATRTETVVGTLAKPYVVEALSWLGTEPLQQSAEPSRELVDSAAEPTSAVPIEKRKVVLLADDNRDMRDYVERLLAAQYRVIAVDNGKVALQHALANPPDLVLTDIMMPEMDGFQLLAALRNHPATSTIPIVLLSARAGDEARIEGMQQGADDYLVKPFSARELIARVQTHLKLSSARKQAMEQVRESEEELRILQRVGATLASELDLKKLVQAVTDAGRDLSQAGFGAFFYNVINHKGESYMLYTLSGAPEEAFSSYPMPRNTCLFGPTFAGKDTIRIGDVFKDPRYGKNAPYYGMPPGHLPVRSYLAVPVISRSGEVLGGLFYGHPETGVFTERAERLVEGIAKQAAVAIDNARLFEEAQQERVRAKDSEQRLRAVVDTTPECVKIVARDGTLLYMNTAGCAMIGADSPQQVVGKNIYKVIAPEDRDRFQIFNEAICRGKRESLEFDIVGMNGVRRHMESHAVPLPYGDGRTVHLAVTRDITDRSRSERRIAAQHAITRILAESEFLAEAAEPIIRAICDTREWRFGAFWEVNGEQLKCIATFPGCAFPDLDAKTSAAVFESGIGLPGRVWRTGQPSWIPDLARDKNFPRAHTAAREGLRSGFAFPITLPGKTIGVLELFTTDSREPDGEFTAMMSAVGAQIGQFVERRRAELALRQSEEEFRDFAENATIGLHRVGPDGTILWTNKAELELLGYSWEEYVGHNIAEFHADAPVIEDMLKKLSCGEKLREYEARMRTKSGDVRYVLVDSSVRFEDGKFIYTRCLTRDISDRKRADDELRRRASQFETVFNQAPIGVFLLDSELRLRQVNPIGMPAFSDIPDLIGRNFDEVIYKLWNKEYADEIVGIFRQTLQTGEPYETPERVEYRIDRNETEYSEWRVDRIQLPEGGYGVVCYFRDISERVKARIALQEQEERLKRTEKMAAAGQLAASLAHEINNPLSSVTNALYLLKGDPDLHQEAKGLANTASTELARVSRIVKQSLSYYRVGTVPKPFDLAAVVEESLQIFSEKFQRAGVQVTTKSSPGYQVIGFADEARQVIDNLLLNAVEATPSGGHLAVSVHPSGNWGNQRHKGVRLTIADTGSGIPKENLSKIFEPFFTTKPEKGTGLGLWVVRGIVAKHDGTMRIRSSEGKRSGTVISILWPSSRAERRSAFSQSGSVA